MKNESKIVKWQIDDITIIDKNVVETLLLLLRMVSADRSIDCRES